MKRSARILFFSLAAGIGAAVLLLHGSLAYRAARWSARETLELYLLQEGILEEGDLLEFVMSRPYRDSNVPGTPLWRTWTPWPGQWQYYIRVMNGSERKPMYRVAEHGRYVYPIYIDPPLGGYIPLYILSENGGGDHLFVYDLVAAGGGILLFSLGGLSIYALYRRLSPPKSAAAQVLEIKDCDYSQVIVGHYGLLNRRDTVVLFQVEGTVLGLFCGQELREALEKGADGLLTYRGTRALSFLRDGGKTD